MEGFGRDRTPMPSAPSVRTTPPPRLPVSTGPTVEALVVPGGNFLPCAPIAAWEQQFQSPRVTPTSRLWAMMGDEDGDAAAGLGAARTMPGVLGSRQREQGEAGEDAAHRISLTFNVAWFGYQRLQTVPHTPRRASQMRWHMCVRRLGALGTLLNPTWVLKVRASCTSPPMHPHWTFDKKPRFFSGHSFHVFWFFSSTMSADLTP